MRNIYRLHAYTGLLKLHQDLGGAIADKVLREALGSQCSSAPAFLALPPHQGELSGVWFRE